MARFVGRDTFAGVASAPQTGNRYTYGLNNPFRYTDPSGHFVQAALANPGYTTSFLLQLVPGVGDGYSALTGMLGFDPIAGVSLEGWERAAVMAAAMPFVIGGAGLIADAVPSPSGLHALTDGVADAATGGRALHVDGAAATVLGGPTGDVVRSATKAGAPARQALLNGAGEIGSRSLVGRPAREVVRTLETSPGLNPQGYVERVASQYRINLRGSGRRVHLIFDPLLPPGQLGVTRAVERGELIRIGPDAVSGGDILVANTIAHELNHARYLLRHGSFAGDDHRIAYAAGDALEEWLRGLR